MTRLSAHALCALFAGLFMLSSPALADPLGLGVNLISNPGAEFGTSFDGSFIELNDWTITGGPTGADGFFGVPWGQPGGFPTYSDPGPVVSDRGTYFFAGGADNASSSVGQLITGLSSDVQADIDIGKVHFDLNGWLGGYSDPGGGGQEDNAVLSIVFRNAQSGILGTAQIGPVSDTDRGHQTALLFRKQFGLVPTGTRAIDVTLTMTRLSGIYNDGYADNLSLMLLGPAPFNIFQWSYINPQVPSQGKQESHVLTVDGYGLHAEPGLVAANMNLAQAYLVGVDLTNANFTNANLTSAEITQANLTNTNFSGATLTRANLHKSNLTSALFDHATLTRANLNQANLTAANLTVANLTGANLTEANLTNANVKNANLSSTHITLGQLYSTFSYKNHDLTGVQFVGNDLSGANLAGQQLGSTSFYAAKLVGADLTNADLTNAELVNADLSQANLSGANFTGAALTLANLSHANLTNANLSAANFIGTNLTGAEIRGANLSRVVIPDYDPYPPQFCGPKGNGVPCEFSKPILIWGIPSPPPQPIGTGIALAQLVSTASYGAGDLSNTTLMNNNFNGGNFAGFNLTNANFTGTTIVGANFAGADARGAFGLGGVAAPNFIRSDGHIAGLNLSAGQTLAIRDYDGTPAAALIPIKVDQQLAMAPGGTLRMIFEADAWDSTISFAAGIPVTLGGNLELAFAADVNLASQIGRTFDLFDWTGVSPTGAFALSSPYVWDLSNLYTTGEVTFLAASGLAGDVNGDGAVNAADYTALRNVPNAIYTLAAFNVWKSNYGTHIGNGGSSALGAPTPLSISVPEPSALVLLGVGIVVLLVTRSRPDRMLHRRAGGFLAITALLFISAGPASASTIELTKIGAPTWKPVDFQLFSAPATPFDPEFWQVYNALLPYDTPRAASYTPHAPPYDAELSAGMIAGGYLSRGVFPENAITLHPNGVYFAFMLVPAPGITGSSRDFAAGPVIPNSIFPIVSNIDVWLDGVLVDRVPGADGIIPVQPRDVAFQGTSHLESLQAIWHPWDDDLTVGPLGSYELRASVRDVGGSGWDVVASFQVVPEPATVVLLAVGLLGVVISRRQRATRES